MRISAAKIDRVRVLLGAVQCEKGDLSGNLARHVALMKEAHHSGCDLAVFPEFSLTGSVDPLAHPEHALALEHPAVEELVDATAAVGVGVVFGLAEHRDGHFFITQAYAVRGELLGVQRKRHLGEGEEAYTTSSETAAFEFGSARFGSIICAESGVDFTWDATVATGAQLVFMTSAPGLHGRRVSEAEWRAGFEWWESCGLADARHHAARLGVWVAMATQAGSTVDEDFPGIAALIGPNGDVVERQPDWRPGHLIVDVSVAVEVDPVRWSIRVLLIDEAGRTLLAQFGDDRTGKRWWVPPGGGIEEGEDDLACARRELLEEVGRDDLPIGPCIGRRGGTFPMRGEWFTQYERWYLSRCQHFEVDRYLVASLRQEGIRDMRWWSLEEIETEQIQTGPRNLAGLLRRVQEGHLPDATTDLGF
ncbi:MAG: nitrilase-related carbon-nitrogen hydrolase [Microthrixaceae bacterium]